MQARAKFRCNVVKQFVDGSGNVSSVEVGLNPVTGQGENEDAVFWKYTPNGNLQMTITNPELFETFRPGMVFYLDFTEAPSR